MPGGALNASLRAKRSNPAPSRSLDCFVALLLAMTRLLQAVLPGSPQHAQPISKAHLLDQGLGKATLAHRLHQILQSAGIAQFGRDEGAVEIGAQSDAVLAGV